MPHNPFVIVVTLNYNGKKHLGYFLRNALKIKYSNYEIVVVDNGSSDNSIDFLENNFGEINLIKLSKNYGYSSGFNKGINYAINKGADYILITNNDVLLHRDIIKEGVKLAETNDRIGYLGGKVFDLNTNRKFQYAGGRFMLDNRLTPSRGRGEYDNGQYEDVEYFDFMDDVCVLVKSRMVEEIGAYDDDFFFDWEETEWNSRIINSGYKIVYNPKMLAWHRKHGSTSGNRFSEIPEKYHWRGKILFYFKTGLNKNSTLYFLIKILLVEIPIHWLYLIINNNSNLIRHNLKGIMEGLCIILKAK